MVFNESTEHVFKALEYVSACTNFRLITSNEIASACDIPVEWLYKLLQQLVKVNILQSKRGPKGGFLLVRPLNQVTALEVIEAVEGPVRSKLEFTPLQIAVHKLVEALRNITVAKVLGL